MNQQELQHLLSRAAFGMSVQHLERYKHKSRSEVVEDLFARSNSVIPLSLDFSELLKEADTTRKQNKTQVAALLKKNKNKWLELNEQWMEHIMSSEAELRERMCLFWTNHFVCKDRNVYHMQLYLNLLREKALGNFGTLVKQVSKQPAMLKYLNGRQNRKVSPNENFARELMELFTLGEGHYSECDVREAARAFTGYSHNFKGDFILRKKQHDFGKKRVLGQVGFFNGDNIIDIILDQEQCAKFICTKLYTYFVNPIPNTTHINEMVKVFSKSLDITNVMRFLFLEDWFYDATNRGVKIKSPVDLLASAYRLWPYKFESNKTYFKLQKLLGQELLNPPNVAGWPGDRSWIDVNTLMIRLKLPSLLYGINLKTDKSIPGFLKKHINPVKAESSAQFLELQYRSLSNEELIDLVLTGSVSFEKSQHCIHEDSLSLTLVRLMSVPEFQMA